MTITLKGASRYIYTYIMHNASTQSRKVPISLELGLKYSCKKINKGCHTLEMSMNGMRHDIPNVNHLREKGRRNEGV